MRHVHGNAELEGIRYSGDGFPLPHGQPALTGQQPAGGADAEQMRTRHIPVVRTGFFDAF